MLVPKRTRNTYVVVCMDTIAAMYALKTGRTRDDVLAACAREVWVLAVLAQLDIIFLHTPGVDLVLADALISRSALNPALAKLTQTLVAKQKLTRIAVASPVISDVSPAIYPLFQQMAETYSAALARGTLSNRS